MAGIPGEDPMVLSSFLLLRNVDSFIAITMNLCACYGYQAEESQLQNGNVFMTYSQIKSCSGAGMLSINSRTMVPFFLPGMWDCPHLDTQSFSSNSLSLLPPIGMCSYVGIVHLHLQHGLQGAQYPCPCSSLPAVSPNHQSSQ